MRDIKVIAFDIDGTLYSSVALYIRLIPYIFRHLRFYIHYSRVRKLLHRTAPLSDFYEYQARLLAKELSCTNEAAKQQIQSIAYDGLKPYFRRIQPFRYVAEAFEVLKKNGYRLALLSDFPPEQKGDVWGLASLCDFVMGTEKIGALKPSKYPFGVMVDALGVRPNEVLYVGNSIKCDVRGANNAGMKSAVKISWVGRMFCKGAREADISFSNYRQFVDVVLK